MRKNLLLKEQKIQNCKYFTNVNCLKAVGSLTIVSIILLSGCAAQSASTKNASAEAALIAPAADSSAPTLPEVAAAPVIEPVIVAPKKTELKPETGSVASVLKKMETSPYTLYWRSKNTYSYYVGGLFDAEYKPGEGLIVKDESSGDASLTCKYDDAGSLGNVEKDQKMKEACGKLMFSLDNELSD